MASDDLKTLLGYDASARYDDDEIEEISNLVQKISVDDEHDEDNLRKVFTITQSALKNVSRKNRENKLQLKSNINDMERMKKELSIFQQDPGNSDARELQSEIARLESRNETLNNEMKDLETKYYQEKQDKDKYQTRIDKLEKDLSKYRRDCERYEEDIREYGRQIQTYRDEKYSRTGDEQGIFREKINLKNKVINELEDENAKLAQENLSLSKLLDENKHYLQDSTFEMNKTRDDIRKLRLLQQHNDETSDQMKKENDVLRSQVEVLNQQLLSHQTQDDAIMHAVDARVKEYRLIVQSKDEEIKQLDELVIQLKEGLGRAQLDSDKTTVTALTRAVAEKDRQMELLKRQCEEYAREMDKSTTVIQGLNKTFSENSKIYSKSSQYNTTKGLEQKIVFLERMVGDGEERLKESEAHAAEKEKELAEVAKRMREYESGDYQLQEAVDEIKGLKGQIRVRDRDIENLTKSLNKVDVTLNEVLEENDELRAKLGMEPKEKLDLEEVSQLKAVRSQEVRAVMHVLTRDNERLEEERNSLKQTIRKLARQLGPKCNVASIIDEDYLYDNVDSSGKERKRGKEENQSVSKQKPQQEKQPGPKSEQTQQMESMLKKRNEQLMQLCLEFENKNKLLEKGLNEIHTQIKDINKTNATSTTTGGKKLGTKQQQSQRAGSTEIKCPSLDKLLVEMEQDRSVRSNSKTYAFLSLGAGDDSTANGINLALKGEIDFLQGRNEELRVQLMELKTESKATRISLARAEEEAERLSGDVKVLNSNSSAKDIFQACKLPAGMAPSSQDIIAALNEYLIDTLQELDEYKRVSHMSERDLETLRRKYSVVRHQVSLLYKEYLGESAQWKVEKAKLEESVKRLTETAQGDAVKLQEYDRLLDTLEKDEGEVRTRLAESSRQMFLLRTREKQLQRKCAALTEVDETMIKENKKLRVESIEMEVAVQQRFGYLERYKDMANFRIASLQRQLEESVTMDKLETVNREYADLTAKYRELLEKRGEKEGLTSALAQTEQVNKKLESECEFLRKELECEKDRSHMLEESLERLKLMPMSSELGFASATASLVPQASVGESSNLARRLTAIEMKELNERQRADHAQRMYDEQRTVLRQLENRNLEVENNMSTLNKNYLSLLKSEQDLREELSQSVPRKVNDQDKLMIQELQKQESCLKLEVSRLRELTEITLYQTASLEFINNLNKAQLSSFGLIDVQTSNDEADSIGRLHRQQIMLQISEATAVRKLQQAQQQCKRLEAQLIRSEQKYDRENLEFYNMRKEQISRVSYLRSTIQDLRHKYSGSIPLKQQEAFSAAKAKLDALKAELNEKLVKVGEEKCELEDKIAEYEERLRAIDVLKSAAVMGADGQVVRFNEKALDSFNRSESLRMMNLKLERANRRYKDEITFLEEMNRKHEIGIIACEEENLRLESEYEQKLLVWEHRESELERQCEALKKQHQMIESLAINFEEISGNMPDHTLPISGQLDQAMNIIRSHIKLLAEAKIQSDLSKRKLEELEAKARKLESDVNIRDKVINDLRLRMPATADRDAMIENSMGRNRRGGNADNDNLTSEFNTPVKAAQATIASLQQRLKQKEQTIQKYQDMLKLAREEINQVNKQNELEINNMLDKLNLTRDTNLAKLKQELKFSANESSHVITASRSQLNRLQELEEVTVEQDNTISALQQKIKRLNTELETWRARYEMLSQKSANELQASQKQQQSIIEKLNSEIEEFRGQINGKESEIENIRFELDNQRELNSKSPSDEVKAIVDKLKAQLAQKEEQQRVLNEALNGLKADMVNIAKSNLTSLNEEEGYEKRIQHIMERTNAEHQDKLYSVEEDLARVKKELKMKLKENEELKMEVEDFKTQLRTKEQKIKRLTEENVKLADDKIIPTNKVVYQNYSNNNNPDALNVDHYKRQIRLLEEKLKRHRPAERPYDHPQRSTSPQKQPAIEPEREIIIRTVHSRGDQNSESSQALKREVEQWRTRYNFVVSENSTLVKMNKDLEEEVKRFSMQADSSVAKIMGENKMLRTELDKMAKSRSFSPSKSAENFKAENKLNLDNQRLKKENDKLREQVRVLMDENIRLRSNDDSISSNSSVKRIGESGKSTHELEKTISLMKKLILKLQNENETLKARFS